MSHIPHTNTPAQTRTKSRKQPGIESATPRLPTCPSNYSAIGTVDDILLKNYTVLFTLRYYKNSVWCARDIIVKKKITMLTYSFVIDTI